MNSLFLLTQGATSFLRPIARVLGWIMEGIYNFLDSLLHIQNIALTIVIFTIIVYLIMLPLTYQQQKFSKMSMIMQPELNAIQKKYRGKKDSVSMQKQNEETQAVYKKYGVRPSGSCLLMVIQLLILFPLYRVINSVPGYVTRVRETFSDLVAQIMYTDGYQNTMKAFLEVISDNNSVMRSVSLNFEGTITEASNTIVDVLYRCTSSNWQLLARTFDGFSDLVVSTQAAVEHFNSFLGASIVYAPMGLIRTSAAEGRYLLILVAIMIPVVSAGSQFLSVRLMPQANTGSGDQMGSSMRTMNYIMPIYSFFIVFFLPIGIGIYWIAGAVIRIIQQILINRHFDRIDMNELVEANKKKAEERQKKKVERKGVSGSLIQQAAAINTKSIPRSMSEKAASVAKISSDIVDERSSAKSGSTKSTSTKSASTKSTSTKSTSTKSTSTKNTSTKSTSAKSTSAKSAAAKNGSAKSSPAKSAAAENVTAESAAAENIAAESASVKSTVAKSGSASDGAAKSGPAQSGDAAKSGSARGGFAGNLFGRNKKSESEEAGEQPATTPDGKYKAGSLAAMANKVNEYNERNSK